MVQSKVCSVFAFFLLNWYVCFAVFYFFCDRVFKVCCDVTVRKNTSTRVIHFFLHHSIDRYVLFAIPSFLFSFDDGTETCLSDVLFLLCHTCPARTVHNFDERYFFDRFGVSVAKMYRRNGSFALPFRNFFAIFDVTIPRHNNDNSFFCTCFFKWKMDGSARTSIGSVRFGHTGIPRSYMRSLRLCFASLSRQWTVTRVTRDRYAKVTFRCQCSHMRIENHLSEPDTVAFPLRAVLFA